MTDLQKAIKTSRKAKRTPKAIKQYRLDRAVKQVEKVFGVK